MSNHLAVAIGAVLAGIINRAILGWVRADPRAQQPRNSRSDHPRRLAHIQNASSQRATPRLTAGIQAAQPE